MTSSFLLSVLFGENEYKLVFGGGGKQFRQIKISLANMRQRLSLQTILPTKSAYLAGTMVYSATHYGEPLYALTTVVAINLNAVVG